MAANDLIKLIIGKRVRQYAEIVDDVCGGTRIRIDSDRAWVFVLPATDVENFLRGYGAGLRRRLEV
jgi:hypothetical protein